MIFVGLDASGRLVCLLDAAGQLVAGARLREGWWGLRQLHGLLADSASNPGEVVVGVEQQRGPLVELVAAAGYRVFALSGPTVALCRLLRSAIEGSEPSRAAVSAGLVRSLYPTLQPLTASVSLGGYARHHRQLVWARRHEQQRLRVLLARRTSVTGWPSDTDLNRLGVLRRVIEALGSGNRVGSNRGGRVGACLAALDDLELRIDGLERRLFEALLPHITGGDESWQAGDEERAGLSGPSVGSWRAERGRIGVATVAMVGLSLGLVAADGHPAIPRPAGVVVSPPPGHANSKPQGDRGLWFAAASVNMGTKLSAAEPDGAGPDHLARALRPVAVEIPAIDLVTPPLVNLGLNADGGLEVPTDFARAGWYADSAIPGSPGPAVIVGHYDSRSGPAVFYRLSQLSPGDAIVVSRSDDSHVTFLVERVARYPKDHFPTEEVYGPTREPTLRLITCGGRFDRATGHYEDNSVVFARQPPS